MKLILLSLLIFMIINGMNTYFAWQFNASVVDTKVNFCIAWIACFVADKLIGMKK